MKPLQDANDTLISATVLNFIGYYFCSQGGIPQQEIKKLDTELYVTADYFSFFSYWLSCIYSSGGIFLLLSPFLSPDILVLYKPNSTELMNGLHFELLFYSLNAL